MTASISHRGPDGDGFFRRDGIAFGHRRLAIIDIATGRQPMCNEDGSVWITFNGEIYNYRELREELVDRGHVFATQSDTEVIVHGYEEWGPECVTRLRGMFAFAIADFNRRRVLLARDHLGIKPLYYRTGPGFLAFGSELSVIRAVDAPVPAGNLQSIEYFLRFQYVPTPHTIYRDTLKLPPASYLLVDFDGTHSLPVRYWDLRFDAAVIDGIFESEADSWEQRTARVIRDSVEAHLVSDVPFGVFLSGGIDSTLVAMEMARMLETPVRAFGIGFDEAEYNELDYARQAAAQSGVELVTDVVREDDALEILPELVAHYGEPFGDTSSIPTWFVSRLARAHVPMVLSGDGGDEAFGGYDSYRRWVRRPSFDQAVAFMKQGHPRGAVRSVIGALRRELSGATRSSEWQAHIAYVGADDRRALWRDDHHGVLGHDCDGFAEPARRARDLDNLSFAQYLDYQTYLPNDILTKVDVASMFHGLEVRTPLIDRVVVEHAAGVPTTLRMRADSGRGHVGKYLLKRILAREFPESFVHRAKKGFALPRSRWFLPGHRFRALLEQVLLADDSRLADLFNRPALEHQLALHSSERDNSGNLWLLLVLGIWLAQNRDVQFS